MHFPPTLWDLLPTRSGCLGLQSVTRAEGKAKVERAEKRTDEILFAVKLAILKLPTIKA